MVAVVCSLVAALLYAAASVFQHRAAVAAPAERSLRPGLLTHLVAQPWWLAGITADGLAFVFQFVALSHGPLVIVQPLLVSGLLFALPLGAAVSGTRMRPSELWAATVVVAGLAILLLSANPARGHAAIHTSAWMALLAATLVPAAALAGLALVRPVFTAPLLATAAGVIYGLTAALTKATGHLLGIGILHTVESWQPYALVGAGLVGMVVSQSAFQAGPLRASLPLLTVVDPLVSIIIGVCVFHEHVDQNPARVVIEVCGAAIMVVGVFALGRSPLLTPEGPMQEMTAAGASAPASAPASAEGSGRGR
ncbi:MAG TPA: DMT family transporter [Acidimicrobiales bacterium]